LILKYNQFASPKIKYPIITERKIIVPTIGVARIAAVVGINERIISITRGIIVIEKAHIPLNLESVNR
jgi:hypothetical protein